MALPVILRGAFGKVGKVINPKAPSKPKGLVGGSSRSHVNYFSDKYKKYLQEKGKQKGNSLLTSSSTPKNFNVDNGTVEKIINPTEEKVTPKGIPSQFKGLSKLPKTVGKLPRVGSIGLLLIVILFILFAIQRVGESKETRISLFWKTLLGRTSITEENTTEENTSTGATVLSGNGSGTVEEASKQAGSIIINGVQNMSPTGLGMNVIEGFSNLIQGIGE